MEFVAAPAPPRSGQMECWVDLLFNGWWPQLHDYSQNARLLGPFKKSDEM